MHNKPISVFIRFKTNIKIFIIIVDMNPFISKLYYSLHNCLSLYLKRNVKNVLCERVTAISLENGNRLI